jgi:hypothetical protein
MAAACSCSLGEGPMQCASAWCMVPKDSGGFRDDLPSALPSNGSNSSCASKMSPGQMFTSGNVRATVRGDQTLLIERVSDGQQLFHTASPAVAWAPTSVSGVSVSTASLELDSPPDPVFGLGQHHDPTLREYNLLPDNGETTVPLMHWPLAGATLLINVPSAGKLSTKPGSVSWQSEACLQLDLWVATTSGVPSAGSWPELLRKYVRATGHPAALPAWATGFVQSKDRYDSQSVVENVSAGFAARQLPLSMLVIDWQSWAPAPRGDERFGSGFPDPKAMVAALAARQVQLMVSPYHNMVDCTPGDGAAGYRCARMLGAKCGALINNVTCSKPAECPPGSWDHVQQCIQDAFPGVFAVGQDGLPSPVTYGLVATSEATPSQNFVSLGYAFTDWSLLHAITQWWLCLRLVE